MIEGDLQLEETSWMYDFCPPYSVALSLMKAFSSSLIGVALRQVTVEVPSPLMVSETVSYTHLTLPTNREV